MLDSPPVNWFTENPTPVLLAGGAILIFLVLRFFKTGEFKLFLWMAGVGAFMGLAVLTDHLIVTDREQVENVIYKAGADAEHNNLEAVIDIIAPEATLVRTDARQWIGQVHLNLVNIGGLDVQLDKTANPPTARARFWVRADGEAHTANAIYHNYMGHLIVDLRKVGDRWLVTAYQHD